VDNRYQLLYDGACPVCSREVLWLYRRRPDAIEAVDISLEGFDASAYGLTAEQVDGALYGIRPDGGVTVGMDSLREAYRLGGLGWLVAWTGWWPARPVFDALYRGFARNRMRIGRLLGRGNDDCGDGCRF
jgi:predicted DCC family thiol-disulfide oxidoreductase YuxK